ncbi:MAG TPA: sensor histidine kinase [Rectinemataceae bacterium]|nr:sensor histidine kinase [Rectinemataceae bacterium]
MDAFGPGRDIRSVPTFFSKSTPVKVYLLAVLAVTYFFALAFYPLLDPGPGAHPYLRETYIGCIGISVALSGLALLSRSEIGVVATTILRCYMLAILGYGLGAYLTTKLVLGIGLVVEVSVLCSVPLNLGLSALVIAVLALMQAFPVFFGFSAVVQTPAYPREDEIAVLSLLLSFAALASAWIDHLCRVHEELEDALRIQVSNIDTLAELNRKLQGYARTIEEESAERERNRISREIHDISGYIFTNLIALMDAAGSMKRDDHAALTELLVTARRQAQEGLQETRGALRKLRNEDLRLVESAQAIHRIVAIFRTVAGIQVDLNLGNLPHRLPGGFSLALYRTVQEALTNAVRHGRATRVRVNFWVENSTLLLNIGDDGKGAFEVVKGIGITGMEERIGALGGSVEIGRTVEGGFALSVRVPLAAAQKEEGSVRE